MRMLIALPVALALIAAPAVAEPEKLAEDKVVCKRTETTSYTGSHLGRPKKTCKRASEWKESEAERDETMRRVQDGRLSPDQPTPLGAGGPN